jgi:hypothetical protein
LNHNDSIIITIIIGKVFVKINILNMKVTTKNTDWGIVYYYNDKDYRFALYMYNDDPDSLYLSNVKVNQNMRG